jgi:cysteine desulfuration protein SufE
VTEERATPQPVNGAALNPRLQEIADDFRDVPDKDRLQLLLEFSRDLPALPERYAGHRDRMEPVPECQTPLFLAVEVEPGDQEPGDQEPGDKETVHLYFDAPAEAPTTRGFAAILHAGLDGLDADEVLATPPEFSSQLGLAELVSPLRLRGMAAMLSRIKRQIREHRAAK